MKPSAEKNPRFIRNTPTPPSVFSGIAGLVAGFYGYSAMLLVQNLPQPARRIVGGGASACERRLRAGARCRGPRRERAARGCCCPKPLFQV